MEVIRNIKLTEFGLEGEVFFKCFNKYISLFVEDGEDTEYAQICARYLNELTDPTIIRLCEASIRYCNNFLDAVGEPLKTFEKAIDVLKLISPSVLIVPYPENGDEPVIHLELNCEWEPEHGLEWIVRADKVLYVGAFNGEYSWDEFSSSDLGNYA
ncbi:DUF6985 domain-containing protein [Celerinatantimonas sp. MCCC 1A17872]|uniref:DUF6985 domain-containing protein n=1 Tax=Celerinatantimonas sp. MCCC 1A17872 TaxID=3177514 RepID=UPI0038C89CED